MVHSRTTEARGTRFLAPLVLLLCLASPAVRGEDLDGTGFYPPGDKPNCSLSIWGPVANGKVIINNAYFSPNLLPEKLLLTPAGEKLGISKIKAQKRMGVNIHINTEKPGFHASVVDILFYYPYNLTAMPKLTLKAAGSTSTSACRRDPKEHNVNAVKAIIQLPSKAANKLKFDDTITLQISNSDGNLLEQAILQICNQKAFDAMLADAKKEVLEKSVARLH
ncbi:MAG: hypothetical protein JST89_06650 [Cyanobacteria bacterium SZAS-4]|nr:hypothetical protein [Cyanobacteria bacterium SZAS-4]